MLHSELGKGKTLMMMTGGGAIQMGIFFSVDLQFYFIDILKQVRHRHIVSMHALYESQKAVYIVTDLASGGELFQRLLYQGTFTEKDASHLISQVLEGVVYLHNHDASTLYTSLYIYIYCLSTNTIFIFLIFI